MTPSEINNKIRELEGQISQLKAADGERVQQSRESSYRLSSSDSAKAAETRASNERLAMRTGPRPIGGFYGDAARAAISARTAATDGLGFKNTADFDSASATEEESTRGASAAVIFGYGKTFYVYGSGANVVCLAGAINNVAYAGDTLATPSDGDKVYIDATISGTTVTAVTVSKAASVPADTTTHVHTLLATVAVSGGVATPTPVAWNYSQMQICGGQALWGGFGA